MKPIRIKEEKYRQPPSLKIPVALLATLVTASLIHQYWNSGDADEFVSKLRANEMFCHDPEIEGDGFTDPFITAGQSAPYVSGAQFWSDPSGQKIIHFNFDYNSTKTDDYTQFFAGIPQEVIDDPEVTFILSGHATYDLDDQLGLRSGLMPPKDFEKLHARHLKNNFHIVDGRLDYIKGKLMEAGIAEDRIVLHNFNTRFDRRAVDLEVCVPPQHD